MIPEIFPLRANTKDTTIMEVRFELASGKTQKSVWV